MNDQERQARVGRMHPGELRRALLRAAQLDPVVVDIAIEEHSALPFPVHVPGQIELPC